MMLDEAIAEIRPLDGAAMAEARELHGRLTKPAGSLGVLEELSVRLSGLAGACPPPLPEHAAVAIFAADHGVHAQGVSPWPQEVTAQMVSNFLAGGAVVNAFARQVGATVTVVDVGVATPIAGPTTPEPAVTHLPTPGSAAAPGTAPSAAAPGTAPSAAAPGTAPSAAAPGPVPAQPTAPAWPGRSPTPTQVGVTAPAVRGPSPDRGPRLVSMRVRGGSRDMTVEPALIRDEVRTAVEAGLRTGFELCGRGAGILITGDMGIANTTAAAALIASFTGADPAEVTGRGTGVDDPTYARKVAVVRAALARHAPDPADPIGVLAAVGGLEHAALVGFILAGAASRVPVLLDGVNAVAAALAAVALAPDAGGALVAGHRSAEPGATVGLAGLGLPPLIDLGLRLGEGTGALLALPVVAGAVRVLHEVATFDAAGVSEK